MRRSLIVPAAMAMMFALGAQAQEVPQQDEPAVETTESAADEAMDTMESAGETAMDTAEAAAEETAEAAEMAADETVDAMDAAAEEVAETAGDAEEAMADAADDSADMAEAAESEMESETEMTADVTPESETMSVAAETTASAPEVTVAAPAMTDTDIAALDDLTIEELNARQLALMQTGATTTTTFSTASAPTEATSDYTYETASTEAAEPAESTYASDTTASTYESTEPMMMASSDTTIRTGEIERTVLPNGVTRTVTRVIVGEGESGAGSYSPSTSYASSEATTSDMEPTTYASTDAQETEATGDVSSSSAAGSMEPVETNTIVDVASDDATFTTLVSLIKQAELAEALSGEGPFTVFAPTNAAFGALDADLVARLTSGTANDELATVLKGHVVSGSILASDIPDGETTLTTLAGTDITVNRTIDGVMVGNAMVTSTDIEGSNGVIHVLDSVLLPVAANASMLEAVQPAMDEAESMMDEAKGMMEEADEMADPDMTEAVEEDATDMTSPQ